MARAPMPAPQPLESPAIRRSAMLAKLLEEQRQPVEIRGGYGELAARLLGQGITQFGANRADRQVREERTARTAGEVGAVELTLADVLSRSGRGAPPSAASNMPPPMVPPVPNTQQPVEAMTAPAAAVQGSPMPAAAPAGMPGVPVPMADVPPMPQAAGPATPAPQMAAPPSNALGMTPGEQARIERGIALARQTGDPAIAAWVRGELDAIDQRMSAASEWEDVSVNGVPYLRDQFGNTRATFQNGLPQEAMNQNATVGGDNPYGVAEGTGISLDSFNRPTIVGRPPEGYTRRPGGGLAPEAGGTQDLPNNPRARFEAVTAEQGRLKAVLDQATSLNRNIQAVRAGIRAQNGSGDNAIINGLQRLTDDGVVREGDVALQLRMQGIEGGISGLLGYMRSDGTFSPEIRQQLSRLAEDSYSNQSPLFREQVMGRRDFIERSLGAGAFDDVVPPSVRQAYGWESAPSREAPRQQPRAPRPSAPNRRRPASDNNDPLGLR